MSNVGQMLCFKLVKMRVSKCTPGAIFKRVKRHTSLIVGPSIGGPIQSFGNKIIITIKLLSFQLTIVDFRDNESVWVYMHNSRYIYSRGSSNFLIFFCFCFAALQSRGWKFESPWIQQHTQPFIQYVKYGILQSNWQNSAINNAAEYEGAKNSLDTIQPMFSSLSWRWCQGNYRCIYFWHRCSLCFRIAVVRQWGRWWWWLLRRVTMTIEVTGSGRPPITNQSLPEDRRLPQSDNHPCPLSVHTIDTPALQQCTLVYLALSM